MRMENANALLEKAYSAQEEKQQQQQQQQRSSSDVNGPKDCLLLANPWRESTINLS